MTIERLVLSRDYDLLMSFWTQKGLPPVPKEFLPPTGLICRENQTLLAGGFLVKSDTRAACIGSICGNPNVPRQVRSEALDAVILALAELGVKSGFSLICVSTNVPALQARYQRLGFIRTDENVTHFAGRVS